jgi:hypothetical protein
MCFSSKARQTSAFAACALIALVVFGIAASLTRSQCEHCLGLRIFEICLAVSIFGTLLVWGYLLYEAHYRTAIDDDSRLDAR